MPQLSPPIHHSACPGCPDWTVRDLVWHLGEVHWFWASDVELRASDPGAVEAGKPARPAADAEVIAFGRSQLDRLLQVLASTPDEVPVWTWALGESNHTVGFVRRHQVQETAVHRWDIQSAATSTAFPTRSTRSWRPTPSTSSSRSSLPFGVNTHKAAPWFRAPAAAPTLRESGTSSETGRSTAVTQLPTPPYAERRPTCCWPFTSASLSTPSTSPAMHRSRIAWLSGSTRPDGWDHQPIPLSRPRPCHRAPAAAPAAPASPLAEQPGDLRATGSPRDRSGGREPPGWLSASGWPGSSARSPPKVTLRRGSSTARCGDRPRSRRWMRICTCAWACMNLPATPRANAGLPSAGDRGRDRRVRRLPRLDAVARRGGAASPPC